MSRDPFSGRSTGHRGRLLQWEGHDLVELESDQLRITLSLTRGAEILELRHKGTDLDVLWHGHQDIRRNRPAPSSEYGTGGWIDSFAGGWQTVLPTAAFPARIGGAAFGLHGEAALLPWNLELVEEADAVVGVHLGVELRRVPLRVTRHVTLASARVKIRDVISNLSMTGLPFQFGHHIVFGEAVARPGSTIQLPNDMHIEIPGGEGLYGDVAPGGYGWPFVRANDGSELDLSRPGDHEGLTGAGAIGPFPTGSARLVCGDAGLDISLAWDEAALPFAWIWFSNEGCQEWPLWGRARLLGFEPFNSRVESIQEAHEHGRAKYLAGGESAVVEIAVTVKERQAEHG